MTGRMAMAATTSVVIAVHTSQRSAELHRRRVCGGRYGRPAGLAAEPDQSTRAPGWGRGE